MHLPPPPPTDRWVTSFFFLTGRGPLHEMAFSAFSRSLLGRTNTFSSQVLLTPRISLNALPLPLLILTLFLLPFPLLLLCTRQNFSMDKASSWFPPISFRALYRLRYLTLFQLVLFVTFSHTALLATYVWQLATSFWVCSLLLYVAFSTFSRPVRMCFLVDAFPVLLLLLYCSSYLSI